MVECTGLENRQGFVAPLGFKSLSLHHLFLFADLFQQITIRIMRWRGGRVAEGAPLLREYRVCSSIEGSNPSFSTILLLKTAFKRFFYAQKTCTPHYISCMLSIYLLHKVMLCFVLLCLLLLYLPAPTAKPLFISA